MSRIRDGSLPGVRVSDRVYRIPIAAFERFVANAPVPEFTVEHRQVKRLRKVGEAIGSDALARPLAVRRRARVDP